MAYTPLPKRIPKVNAVPRVMDIGPLTFPMHGHIVKYPSIIWDVNFYYGDLKVRYDATAAQLRDSYITLNGSESVRLTYVLKQLLNPQVRRAYDACQFGSIFFDRYVAEIVRQRMIHESVGIPAQETSHNDKNDKNPFDFTDVMDQEIVADLDGVAQDGVRSARSWLIGFYQYHTARVDVEKMRIWLKCLCEVMGGQNISLSVGLMGTSGAQDDVYVMWVDGNNVAFLHEDCSPTPERAQKVLEYFQSQSDPTIENR